LIDRSSLSNDLNIHIENKELSLEKFEIDNLLNIVNDALDIGGGNRSIRFSNSQT
jgi:hypothetical protein